MTRRTIEFNPEDMYLRYLFTDRGGSKHYGIFAVEDVNDRKAPPLGTALNHKDEDNLLCIWTADD